MLLGWICVGCQEQYRYNKYKATESKCPDRCSSCGETVFQRVDQPVSAAEAMYPEREKPEEERFFDSEGNPVLSKSALKLPDHGIHPLDESRWQRIVKLPYPDLGAQEVDSADDATMRGAPAIERKVFHVDPGHWDILPYARLIGKPTEKFFCKIETPDSTLGVTVANVGDSKACFDPHSMTEWHEQYSPVVRLVVTKRTKISVVFVGLPPTAEAMVRAGRIA